MSEEEVPSTDETTILSVARLRPYTALRDAPTAHPTYPEALNHLFARL